MFSRVHPDVVYPVSSDVTEHDIDVVSDLWVMEGREVYRGARDPHYTHANVYWLYDEDLDRVGLAEHRHDDHGDVSLHWYYDSPFATLLQEKGWTEGESIWSQFDSGAVDRFLAEGRTTPESILEACLHGPTRVISPKMLITWPTVYSCETCGRKALKPFHEGCVETPLDIPSIEKLFCVDDDLIVHSPPSDSEVFRRERLLHASDPSSQPQALEPVEQAPPSA
jgi:hypothetical protein